MMLVSPTVRQRRCAAGHTEARAGPPLHFTIIDVGEVYTLRYHYWTSQVLREVWSEDRGKVARGLHWCSDTTSRQRQATAPPPDVIGGEEQHNVAALVHARHVLCC
jgi:hypothetical protein